jgi:lactate permease
MLALLALVPLVVLAWLLVVRRWPASRAMPLAYLATVMLAGWVWQVPTRRLAAATIHGLITASTLRYIIFGAILLLNTLDQSGALRRSCPCSSSAWGRGSASIRPGSWPCRR